MSHFKRHLFVCTNERNNPCRKSCGDMRTGIEAITYLKQQAATLGLSGTGKLRISSSGCLGRCEKGPVMVIYPEGRWYTYANQEDLHSILTTELAQGKVVERLLLDQ